MILTGEYQITWSDGCPSATLSTTPHIDWPDIEYGPPPTAVKGWRQTARVRHRH